MSRKMQAIDTGEREKIMKLKSELTNTSGNKVEWLYNGNGIDRDAYLLGKPIDKLILEKETEKANVKEKDFLTNTIDLSNKIREDPLFEIKKREIEAKKRLLENPMKLKQLKEMISRSKPDIDSKGSRNRQHTTKKKKKKRSSSTSSSSESEKEKSKKKKNRSPSTSSSSESEKEKSKKKKRISRSRDRADSNYGLVNKISNRSKSPIQERQFESKSKQEIEDYKKKINQLKDIRSSSSSTYKTNSQRQALTEEEKARRLLEMQSNAKWRDEVRTKNVSKYKSDERKEDKLDEISKSSRMQAEASSLFNNMMNNAYSSAEDRIKRNVYNIQRNKSSYDSHFARK